MTGCLSALRFFVVAADDVCAACHGRRTASAPYFSRGAADFLPRLIRSLPAQKSRRPIYSLCR